MVLGILNELERGDRRRKKIGQNERDELFTEQNGQCNYCGRRRTKRELHIDHKKPFSRDGADSKGNLQLLCQTCNGRKSDMTDAEFRRFYELTPARQAKGPPSKVIPQKYFDEIAQRKRARKAKRRGRNDENWFGWG